MLANGGFSDLTEVAAIEQERRWEGVPAMFDETEFSPQRGGRRKSVTAEMLTAHETSQVRKNKITGSPRRPPREKNENGNEGKKTLEKEWENDENDESTAFAGARADS
jgi:hypothetical protein